MKQSLIAAAILAILGVGGFYALNSFIYTEKQGAGMPQDYKNATYVIDTKSVTLKDGGAETQTAPGAASKTVTRYFGNELRKDLNGDGREDVVFLLTQNSGGSGTFFYVVAALHTEEGYEGTQAVLLGDRVAPQTTESGPGNSIIVNYADRKPGEPMTADPSVGKSLRLLLNTESMQFGEVAQDFEGEADPATMTLGMKTWTWIEAHYNDGKQVKPKNQGAFTILFRDDGVFSARTDCNSVSGEYGGPKPAIALSEFMSTKMYCEGSQEQEFVKMLVEVQSYLFTSKGELILEFRYDSGSMVFR